MRSIQTPMLLITVVVAALAAAGCGKDAPPPAPPRVAVVAAKPEPLNSDRRKTEAIAAVVAFAKTKKYDTHLDFAKAAASFDGGAKGRDGKPLPSQGWRVFIPTQKLPKAMREQLEEGGALPQGLAARQFEVSHDGKVVERAEIRLPFVGGMAAPPPEAGPPTP